MADEISRVNNERSSLEFRILELEKTVKLCKEEKENFIKERGQLFEIVKQLWDERELEAKLTTQIESQQEEIRELKKMKAELQNEIFALHQNMEERERMLEENKKVPMQQTSQTVADGLADLETQVEEILAKNSNSSNETGSSKRKWTLDDFEIGRNLSNGTFARVSVYVAVEKKTKFSIALKVISKSQLTGAKSELQIGREILIQAQLSHPNILKLYGYFQSASRVYLVLEYAEMGDLYKLLQSQPDKKLPEPRASQIMKQVANALIYCHSKGIIHQEIKPENILVYGAGKVKIADFGSSVIAARYSRRDTVCRTVDYLTPENFRVHDFAVDNWCLGVLCYELLCGRPPFETRTYNEAFYNITHAVYAFPNHVSDAARDLIRKMLVIIPHNRLPLAEVVKHPWIEMHSDS